MTFYEPVAVGLSQLRANKLRSFLTLLGIVIGVAAVIGIVSLGEGLRRSVAGEFAQSGGATTVLVRPPWDYENRDGRWVRRAWQEYLTTGDLAAFYDETDDIQYAVPGVWRQVQLRYGKATMGAQVTGTSAEFTQGFSWPVAKGRGLTPDDIVFNRRVCVIGEKNRQELFQTKEPVGAEIKLNGERYTVIGVLAPRVRQGREQGDEVLIPYTTAQKRIAGDRHLMGITLFVDELEAVKDVAQAVRRVLRGRHEHGDEFWVETSENQLQQLDNIIRVMKMVAGGIAGISLLVGGIGIMNIMLVSVTERTREIGVRKAIGAKPRHILFQFLAEAVVLSLAGGVIGVAAGVGFGLGIAKLIQRLAPGSPFASSVSLESVLWAASFALAVGVFFGVYPALRASRMDPVEALRYE